MMNKHGPINAYNTSHHDDHNSIRQKPPRQLPPPRAHGNEEELKKMENEIGSKGSERDDEDDSVRLLRQEEDGETGDHVPLLRQEEDSETGDHGEDSCPGSETDAAAAAHRNTTMNEGTAKRQTHGKEEEEQQQYDSIPLLRHEDDAVQPKIIYELQSNEDEETGRDDTKKDGGEIDPHGKEDDTNNTKDYSHVNEEYLNNDNEEDDSVHLLRQEEDGADDEVILQQDDNDDGGPNYGEIDCASFKRWREEKKKTKTRDHGGDPCPGSETDATAHQ